MSEAERIDLVDRAPLTEKQQNVYESIMQYQRELMVMLLLSGRYARW